MPRCPRCKRRWSVRSARARCCWLGVSAPSTVCKPMLVSRWVCSCVEARTNAGREERGVLVVGFAAVERRVQTRGVAVGFAAVGRRCGETQDVLWRREGDYETLKSTMVENDKFAVLQLADSSCSRHSCRLALGFAHECGSRHQRRLCKGHGHYVATHTSVLVNKCWLW